MSDEYTDMKAAMSALTEAMDKMNIKPMDGHHLHAEIHLSWIPRNPWRWLPVLSPTHAVWWWLKFNWVFRFSFESTMKEASSP